MLVKVRSFRLVGGVRTFSTSMKAFGSEVYLERPSHLMIFRQYVLMHMWQLVIVVFYNAFPIVVFVNVVLCFLNVF